MNKRICITFSTILMCVVVALALTTTYVYPYYQSNSLCNVIRSGNTDKAVQKIQTMKNINCYAAPLYLDRLYQAVESSIDLPLIVACEEGDAVVVKALLEKGADPNQYLDGSWSAFEAAFVRENEDRLTIAKELLKHGADINAYGSYYPALFYELQRYAYDKDPTEEERQVYRDNILFLLENGADTADDRGITVLHYLSRANDVQLVARVLEDAAILIDAANSGGNTPLMWAVLGDSEDVARYLIEAGADQTIKDHEGKTALDYAREISNETLIALLSE